MFWLNICKTYKEVKGRIQDTVFVITRNTNYLLLREVIVIDSPFYTDSKLYQQ